MEANINYEPDLAILNNMTNMNWNQMNVEKTTPLELLTELDYKVFSEILIKNKVLINPVVLKKLEKPSRSGENHNPSRPGSKQLLPFVPNQFFKHEVEHCVNSNVVRGHSYRHKT
jgi:hypothetical protein